MRPRRVNRRHSHTRGLFRASQRGCPGLFGHRPHYRQTAARTRRRPVQRIQDGHQLRRSRGLARRCSGVVQHSCQSDSRRRPGRACSPSVSSSAWKPASTPSTVRFLTPGGLAGAVAAFRWSEPYRQKGDTRQTRGDTPRKQANFVRMTLPQSPPILILSAFALVTAATTLVGSPPMTLLTAHICSES